MSADTEEDEELLSFESAHDSAPSTILLIHGAGASGLDWDVVQPHLSSYHLLMPSLFTTHSIALARRLANTASSSSSSQEDKSNPTTTTNWQPAYLQLLEQLVRSRAKDGRAHIVGLSMGASTAIAFTTAHPDQTLSLFASGTPPLSDNNQQPISSSSSLYRTALYGVFRLQESVSPATIQRLMDGEVNLHAGGWDGAGQRATPELVDITMSLIRGCRPASVADPNVTNATAGGRPTRRSRMYILAATRSKWWMPTADSTACAIDVAKRLSGGTATNDLEVKALEAPRMFHPWSRQAPDVFAACVRAAAEGTPLPEEHVKEIWSSGAS